MKTRNDLKLKHQRAILFIILSLEVIILIINIDKLINFRKQITTTEFRDIDRYYLNIFSNTFRDIANNLTKTFFPKKLIQDNSLINKNEKKKVKIYYKNINKRWINLIKEDVKENIEIEIDQSNPDYLIYAVFGCDHVLNKYNNTIKIAFFTENQIPDLNVADYALGFGHLNHLDRYFTFPYLVYILSLKNRTSKEFKIVRDNVLNSEKRKKFFYKKIK